MKIKDETINKMNWHAKKSYQGSISLLILLLITTTILLLWSTGCRPVYQQMYVKGVKVGEPIKFVPRDTMYRVFKMYRR